MKSSLVKAADFTKIDLGDLKQSFTKEDLNHEIQNDIQKDLLSHRSLMEVNETQEMDIVMVSISSTIPKYNKPYLPLTLGLGLFDKEFERNLIGRKVKEPFTILSEKEPVSVQILSAKRKMVPEFNDAFVKTLGNEEIQTVDDYLKSHGAYYQNFYHEGYCEWYAMLLFEEFAKQSIWNIDEDELKEAIDGYHQMEAKTREVHHMTTGDEENTKEILQIEEDDAKTFFQMTIFYNTCVEPNGKKLELSFDSQTLVTIRKKALKPMMDYLSPLVQIEFMEEPNDN